LATAIPGTLNALTYSNLAMVGLGLTLVGVSQMLTPKTPGKSSATKDDSFLLSGPGNMYEQGNPVPLVYGRCITGSVLISAGIDVESYTNSSSPNFSFGG
jgi:predicted phage tail protein